MALRQAGEDPLADFDVPHAETPLELLQNFLRTALHRGVSSNLNPGRLDVLLQEIARPQLAPDEILRVLDLGCGACLPLAHWREQHRKELSPKPFHYVGVDMWIDLDSQEMKELLAYVRTHMGDDCQPKIRQMVLTDEEMLDKVLQDYSKKIHLVLLDNVIHEIEPKYWERMLTVIQRHLAPGGRMLLWDPDHEWSLSEVAWSPSKGKSPSLGTIPVEWEFDAVWTTAQRMEPILKAVGFDAIVGNEESRSTGFWYIVANSTGEAEARGDVRAEITEAIRHGGIWELARYAKLRKQLDKQLDYRPINHELMLGIVEFFALCASHTRRQYVLANLQ